MLFGKLIETEDEWGFSDDEERFSSFVKMSDEEHMKIIDAANSNGKIIKGDKNGYPVLAEPPEPCQKEKIELRISELEGYLRSTDWYAIRFADTGEPMPLDIKDKRQNARDEISALRESILN